VVGDGTACFLASLAEERAVDKAVAGPSLIKMSFFGGTTKNMPQKDKYA
jgi:hypothetical protein